MARQPILPTKLHDPTGQESRENRAARDFDVRFRKIRVLYIEAVKHLMGYRLQPNADMYDYSMLTPGMLQATLDGVAEQVDRILLEGGEQNFWFMDGYVQPAYQQGTAVQLANLTVQSTAYAASRPTLTALLSSPAYQTRLAFLRQRQYDGMKNISNDTAGRMSQVLQDGLATGKNALEVARDLTRETGVNYRRAELIARTEIPGALRAARMAEADQAGRDLGIKSKEMHLSALSSVTRPTHRARHATLHTTQEQREWWAQDGNRYRCKCSTVTVLVDDEGNPLTPGIVDKARAMLAKNPPPPAKRS